MLGAFGVWLGFPLADPVIGLIITVMILGIVWQSGGAIFTRMLDGVEPHITEGIRHTSEHVAGIQCVSEVRARWLGHRLVTDLEIVVDPALSLLQADAIAQQLEQELASHFPAFRSAAIRLRPSTSGKGSATLGAGTAASTPPVTPFAGELS